MRREAMGLLSVIGLALVSAAPAMAQSEPPIEPLIRTVEIPGSGAVAILPRAWRTSLLNGDDATRRRGPGVWTTDVDTGWTCHLSSREDLVSAEAAADALLEAPEAEDIGISVSDPFQVPVGTAVIVTYGSREAKQPPSNIQREAFVDAPRAVVEVYCGTASAEHLREVAGAIAPLPPDYTPEPFDPRVELPDHGFAVDLGPEWTVGFGAPGSYTGGPRVLTAQQAVHDEDGTPLYTCAIEDASDVPAFQGLATRDDAKAVLKAATEGHRGRLTTSATELPSGPAIRADWSSLDGMPTTAWVVSHDDHVIALWCRSPRPPEDDWRSIAETLEFLSTEE